MGEAKNKILKTLVIIVAVSMIALALSGCVEEEQTTEEKTEISITGSTTVLPIASACSEIFMEKHPDITVTVTGGGSGAGVNSVAKGEVDIGDASRAAKAGDVDDVEGVELSDLVDHTIAVDGVAIIVSKTVYDAGVTNLTSEEVKNIYIKDITNWNEVGGPDATIVVNEREEGSGTRDTFMEALDLEETDADNSHNSNALVKTAVVDSDSAIGYVGLGYVDDTVAPDILLDDYEATTTNIKSGDYPITRSLHMYTLGEATGIVWDFLNFVQGPEGQEIVAEEGFIKMYE